MHAELEPDKTCYALVTPRRELLKARFSLDPVTAEQQTGDEFDECYGSREWVEKSDTSDQWAQDNMDVILAKQKKYYPDWLEKPEAEYPRLGPQDGR